MLRRISAGALDVLQQTSLPVVGGCCDAEGIDTLARAAARRAQELQSLARSERDVGSEPLAMLLEAMAAGSDKDSRLLENLASYLEHQDVASSAPVRGYQD